MYECMKVGMLNVGMQKKFFKKVENQESRKVKKNSRKVERQTGRNEKSSIIEKMKSRKEEKQKCRMQECRMYVCMNVGMQVFRNVGM